MQSVTANLSWGHWIELLSIKNINEMKYYINQAEKLFLTTRELRQRIKNNEYERLDESTKKKLKTFQKNLAKQMKELGKNTAEGFAKGITKGNNSVVAAIAQMTGQTVSQIKKNLGIHSPSRVMAELGGYTGAGFAIGLTKETEGLSQIITDALPKTVDSPAVQGTSVVTPDTAVAAKDSSQLNLYIDSRLIGSAVYRQIDLLQGADIQLRQRGLVR